MVASDGPGEYLVIAEARAGDDAADVTLQSGSIAYITTGGEGSILYWGGTLYNYIAYII